MWGKEGPFHFVLIFQYIFATLSDSVPIIKWSRHLESTDELLKMFEDDVYSQMKGVCQKYNPGHHFYQILLFCVFKLKLKVLLCP